MSCEIYRNLVYKDDDFYAFFSGASPIEELSLVNIGSRPAKGWRSPTWRACARSPGSSPGPRTVSCSLLVRRWHRALSTSIDDADGGLGLLKEMYREWPFFRTLVDFMQMALAKSDLRIAEAYSMLVDDPGVRERIWTRISEEHTTSVRYHCSGSPDKNTSSITPRSCSAPFASGKNPYVDPLSYIQVSLLRRFRDLLKTRPSARR